MKTLKPFEAVEAFRGCRPGDPWHLVGKEKRLQLPWNINKPPTTWKQAEKLMFAVAGPVPTCRFLYAAAHECEPGQELPGVCFFCKRRPFATKAEKEKAHAELAAMKADTSSAGKRKLQAFRASFAADHGGQYPFEVPPVNVGMKSVVPEMMHLEGLNAGKQAHKVGVL